MARDLNKVQLTGYLGADPELRYTAQGSAVTTFRVASGRQWNDASGQRHEDTEWFRVVAWEKLAEICNTYLAKGTRVYVEGRLQTRKWTDREGQDRYTSEVIAQDMIILSPKRAGEPEPDDADDIDWEAPSRAPAPAPAPSRAPAATAAPAAPAAPRRLATPRNKPVPIETDDDIPF